MSPPAPSTSSSALSSHPAWVAAARACFAPPAARRFVAVGPPAAPDAEADLVRHPAYGRGRLGLAGVAELNEPTDLRARDPEALARLAHALAAQRLALELRRVPAAAPTIAALRHAWRGRGLVVVRPYQGSPRIALDATWADPASHLAPRRRADLRRARRRAEAMGALATEILVPGPATVDAALDEVLAVELRSWKGACGAAIAQDPVRGPFFRTFARLASEHGILRLALLRVDGRPAAMQLAAETGGAWWLLKVAYDEAYARLSPGMLLTEATIAHAAGRGLHAFEMLGSPEPWTRLWTEDERACVLVRTYPFTPRGAIALAADGIGVLARRLRHRAPGADA